MTQIFMKIKIKIQYIFKFKEKNVKIQNPDDNQANIGAYQMQNYFDGYKFSKNILKMKFKVPLNSKKILMLKYFFYKSLIE